MFGREKNLKQIKKALNIFEAKIVYMNEQIPDIFLDTSKKIQGDVGKMFYAANKQMQIEFAGEAWEKAIDNSGLMLLEDDKEALKSLSKMLGNTDVDGQISQLKLVNIFIDQQIKDAIDKRNKNEKMYKKLGVIVGLAVVIVLI